MPCVLSTSTTDNVVDTSVSSLVDADSFCIGSLDKIIKSDKELIGVRNNNFFGKAGSAQPCVSPFYQPYGEGHISIENFVNAGFVASNDKEFWYEWRDFNKYVAEKSDGRVFNYQPWPMIRNEQDTWNHIFHAKDKYTSEIIDQEGSGVTYGIINQWGQKDHCESWEKLYVKDDMIYICLLYTSPSPRDRQKSRMPSSA